MARLMSKLLVLLAVLLMPLGMAPASATPQYAHSAASATPLEHCPDPAPQKEVPGFAVCAMACAAALPAVGKSIADAPGILGAPEQFAAQSLLLGLHPETATPPPKRS